MFPFSIRFSSVSQFTVFFDFHFFRPAVAPGQVLGQHLNGPKCGCEPKLWLIAGRVVDKCGFRAPWGARRSSSQTAGHLHKHATCLIRGARRWTRLGPDQAQTSGSRPKHALKHSRASLNEALTFTAISPKIEKLMLYKLQKE